MFWMNKDVFIRLCDDLENIYKVKGSQRISIAEKLGMFLYTVEEGAGNRNVQERFQHSGETVSRYFSEMLNVVCDMAKEFIKPSDPEFKSTPPEILGDSRYMPHFKFTFACAGWEGTAHDTRIFQSAIHNPTLKFPKPTNGKYYLVDAGYPQIKSICYHISVKGQEFFGCVCLVRWGAQPTGYKEVFNHAHSSLRSVIERTFGVWKKRWNILLDMPSYSFDKQVKIVIAAMALHNYIRRYSGRDCVFDESENLDIEGIGREDDAQNGHGHVSREMEALRNNIASSLMGAPI
ncbi:uncharacterized protein LOC133716867 [Rosa rugosa]|uniref:uncharacterized protein LOC133716867 n=1 Tax=Rosa rugosa TaxID=74645 RepID=UPI002B40F4A4|nr:uncharacterized protein LOC133716867 [Rosa rugosa]